MSLKVPVNVASAPKIPYNPEIYRDLVGAICSVQCIRKIGEEALSKAYIIAIEQKNIPFLKAVHLLNSPLSKEMWDKFALLGKYGYLTDAQVIDFNSFYKYLDRHRLNYELYRTTKTAVPLQQSQQANSNPAIAAPKPPQTQAPQGERNYLRLIRTGKGKENQPGSAKK